MINTMSPSEIDIHYMSLALVEAKKGLGRTSPNPCVGAIIVNGNDVVGVGYHKKAGTPHAEVHALSDAGIDAVGATAYVTLEPCSHTGKTPPCCVALVEAKIARVVVGMMDPNALVNGRGVEYLRLHGVEVVTGVLEDQCRKINRAFLKYIQTGRPLMVMKAGFSLDGKITYQKGESGWITGSESGKYVHSLRDQVDAILVGSKTVMIDNPSLTTRLENGDGVNPTRVIIDTNLATNIDSKVYESGTKVFVFCRQGIDQKEKDIFTVKGIEVIEVPVLDSGLDLGLVVENLGYRGVTSVLVEGGSRIHGEFLQKKLYDYAYLFQAPIFVGDDGVSLVSGFATRKRATAVRVHPTNYEVLGHDILLHGELSYA